MQDDDTFGGLPVSCLRLSRENENYKNTHQAVNSNNSNNKVNGLKCLYTNARRLVRGSKREELQILIDNEDIDIIGITETWGRSDVLICELELQGFKMFRKDLDLT